MPVKDFVLGGDLDRQAGFALGSGCPPSEPGALRRGRSGKTWYLEVMVLPAILSIGFSAIGSSCCLLKRLRTRSSQPRSLMPHRDRAATPQVEEPMSWFERPG